MEKFDTLAVARDLVAEAALAHARRVTDRQTAEMVRRLPPFGALAADEAIVSRLRPQVCPRCEGEGKFNPSPVGDPQCERDCGYCGGDGEVAA